MIYRFGLLLSLCFLFVCQNVDTVASRDANSQLLSATSSKARECSLPIPQPILVTPNPVSKRNLDLCTIAILRSECPFVRYPSICLVIYLEEPVGAIPPYLNFNDLIKR